MHQVCERGERDAAGSEDAPHAGYTMGIVPEPEPEPAARSLADLQSMHATDFRLVSSEIGAAVAGHSPPTPPRLAIRLL